MDIKQVHQDTINFQKEYIIAKVAALKLRLPPCTPVRCKSSYNDGLYDVEEIKPEDDVLTIHSRNRQKCQLIDIDKL